MTTTELTVPVIRQGETAALVTPLSVPSAALRDYSLPTSYLEDKGYAVIDATTASDTPRNRSQAFNEAMSLTNRALFPVAGNRYGHDILERIDYGGFAESKPVFVTFSAGSTLACTLYQRTNVTTFYGPHIRFVASDEKGCSYKQAFAEQFWATISGGVIDNAVANTDSAGQMAVKNIYNTADQSAADLPPAARLPFVGESAARSVKGKLLPMFMQSLLQCANNGTVTELNGKLLMLESDQVTFSEALTVMRAIHEILDLRNAAGICVAGITAHPYKDKDNALLAELLDTRAATDFVNQLRSVVDDSIPVTYGFPFGHGAYKATLPFGARTELDPQTNNVTFSHHIEMGENS